MKLMELPCANRELKVTVYSQMPQVKDQLSAGQLNYMMYSHA